MQFGKYNKRVFILGETGYEQDTETGQKTKTYGILSTVWACLAPQTTSNEQVKQGQTKARQNYLVTMRYTDITVFDKLQYGDKVLEVTAVRDKEERHREIELDATEVLNTNVSQS